MADALERFVRASARMEEAYGVYMRWVGERARAVVELRDAGAGRPEIGRVVGLSVASIQRLEARGRELIAGSETEEPAGT